MLYESQCSRPFVSRALATAVDRRKFLAFSFERMNVITPALSNLKGFLQDHHLSFSNGLLILFTVGGEQIFKVTAFQCPCSQPRAAIYGLIFLIVPALLLGLIGIAVSNLTWRVLHGCCHWAKEGKNVSQSRGQEDCPRSNGCSKVCVSLLVVLSRSLTVPVAWLCLTFLDGSYYSCIRSSDPCEKDSPENKAWKEESQMISWCLLLVVVVFSFTVIGITRCVDSVTYVEYKYINAYREAEEGQFDSTVKERTKNLARTTIERFMENPRPKRDWDAIALAPDFAGCSLSPLDEWIKMQPTPKLKHSASSPTVG